jgi:pimeloyl-ACP methyl ester carboxylesterase
MAAAIRPVAETAQWQSWQQVRAPTLLIRGARSLVPDEEIARMVELRPDVEVVTIPDSGHDAHLDQPEAWRELLRGFISATPAHFAADALTANDLTMHIQERHRIL